MATTTTKAPSSKPARRAIRAQRSADALSERAAEIKKRKADLAR